jgi:hypothetical protein
MDKNVKKHKQENIQTADRCNALLLSSSSLYLSYYFSL